MSNETTNPGSTHIVIYGSPGVGKLTVARELASLTGYKLAHNHLSIDFAGAVFQFGTPPFARLVDAVRLQMAEAATREGFGLIHTFVLLTDQGDAYLRDLCAVVEGQGGRIEFVQLACDLDVLRSRIDSPERAAMKKVRTTDLLQSYINRGVLTKRVEGRETFVVDNTDVQPAEAARRIAEHYGLLPPDALTQGGPASAVPWADAKERASISRGSCD